MSTQVAWISVVPSRCQLLPLVVTAVREALECLVSGLRGVWYSWQRRGSVAGCGPYPMSPMNFLFQPHVKTFPNNFFPLRKTIQKEDDCDRASLQMS